ncbi:MAG: prolyl oligopeptidase family serine peptidase, partial [Candidatus Bathyarchaeota archaeon]|nr:prolyl oligopeptidase family serine peptidase [Candidatus Bathyarchaeota archaeon]
MTYLTSDQLKKSFSKEVKYLLYLPHEYNSDTERMWPLLVFLHGAGERGEDLETIKLHGPPKLIETGKKMPFVVVSPQLAIGERWSPDIMAWVIKDLLKTVRIDSDRIYLTGLSMGGNGAWETAAKYPELFAAIAPICGLGDPSIAWRLRNIPIWIFHGAKDPVVPIKHSDDMYTALKQYENVKYTVYPEAGHDSYTDTYLNEELYSWFLSQRRFRFTEAQAPNEPEKFMGRY